MFIETLLNTIGTSVTGAIQKAATATGTGFSYLLATAKIESGLDPQIKAKTSSATGLFQFIEQTWLATMKESGAEFGYGRYAAAIQKTSSGRHVVNDPALRSEILNLRKDPTANAAMAGALTRHNATKLRARIGRDPTEGELYIAHFLGAGGAGKLINAAAKNPHVKAADLFPRAAAANRSIFYDKQGGARSVTGVYGVLVTKLARAMPVGSTQVVEAPATSRPAAPVAKTAATPALPPAKTIGSTPTVRMAPAVPAPSRTSDTSQGMFSPSRVSSVSPTIAMPSLAESIAPLMVPPKPAVNPITVAAATPMVEVRTSVVPPIPTKAPAPVSAQAPVSTMAYAPETSSGPVFHDLFRTDGRAGVSAAVSELWGVRTASTAPQAPVVATPVATTPAVGTNRRLDPYRVGRSPT